MLKKLTTPKLLFLLFGFSLFIFTPANVWAAGLVPCGLGANDPCTLCHFLVGIKGLIDWGMKILITLSITGISIAGVIYVVSSGDSELTKKAKGFVTSVVIGFSLMLGAWLMINTLFYLFSAKKGADGKYSLGLESKNWYSFSCSTTSTSVGGLTPTTEAPIANFSCDAFAFQTTSVAAQCKDASPELQTLMLKMRNLLGSKMTINSISDNNGGGVDCYRNNPSWKQCTNDSDTNCCHHGTSSCHYGGVTSTKGGKSQAIDVSTKTGLTVGNITTAANNSGAGYIKDESEKYNHVHVSTQSCRNN